MAFQAQHKTIKISFFVSVHGIGATNEHELIFKEEVFGVVGRAMEVLNEPGYGLLEKPYENALVVELGLKDISVQQQSRYKLTFYLFCVSCIFSVACVKFFYLCG